MNRKRPPKTTFLSLPLEIHKIVLDHLLKPYDYSVNLVEQRYKCYCSWPKLKWGSHEKCTQHWSTSSQRPSTSILYVCKKLSPLAQKALSNAFTGTIRVENIDRLPSGYWHIPAPTKFWNNIRMISLGEGIPDILYERIIAKAPNLVAFKSKSLIDCRLNQAQQMRRYRNEGYLLTGYVEGDFQTKKILTLLNELKYDWIMADLMRIYAKDIRDRGKDDLMLCKYLEIKWDTQVMSVIIKVIGGGWTVTSTYVGPVRKYNPTRMITYLTSIKTTTAEMARREAPQYTKKKSSKKASARHPFMFLDTDSEMCNSFDILSEKAI